jgi:hypothetical protein
MIQDPVSRMQLVTPPKRLTPLVPPELRPPPHVNYGSFSFAALARPVSGLLSHEDPGPAAGPDRCPDPGSYSDPDPGSDAESGNASPLLSRVACVSPPRPRRTVPAKRLVKSIDDFVVADDSSDAEFVYEKRARSSGHVSESEDDGSDLEFVCEKRAESGHVSDLDDSSDVEFVPSHIHVC